MTQEKYTRPNGTSQDTSTYKANIDNGFEVFERGLGSHFQCHEQDTPNMTVRLQAGVIWTGPGSVATEVAAQNSGTITAPSSNPRIDRIVVTQTAGAVVVVSGAESASPSAPAISGNHIPIAQVALTVGQTTIQNEDITDERPIAFGLDTGGGSGISSVAADATPELGGNLDANGYNITSVGAISFDSALTSVTPASTDRIMLLDASDSNNMKVALFSEFGSGGGLTSVAADTSPELGGNLDCNGYNLTSVGALSVEGNITVTGTVDGRDVATDGTKLDGIEASADVTDETNVVAALDGATLTSVTPASTDRILLLDASDSNNTKVALFSEFGGGGGGLTSVAADTTPQLGGNLDAQSFTISAVSTLAVTSNITVGGTVDGRDVATDGTKLDGIEALADVTDETNVVAALSGATLTSVTPASTDRVLLLDASDTNNLKIGLYSEFSGGGGGGSMSGKEFWFAAESLQPLETNIAPLELLQGTNVKVFVRAFDDSTEEYVNGKIQVPGDVDTSGTVTFRAYVMAKTAAASKNVALTFGHLALNDSEDFDPTSPYTDEDSGDKAIDATQDDITEITWSETISNLGWAANDLVLFRVSRPNASANDLAGDMYMFSFTIEVPRA